MPDMNVSIDQIRDASLGLMRSMDSYRNDNLEDLSRAVEAYDGVVTAINERIRAAHVMLRQGRTADALHACEVEPNVLESVAELDAADQTVEAWRAALEDLGIPVPERLLSDPAAELNAAYDVKHQLAHLMRTHRLLAIAQGPLEDRVATLRSIAHLNPENPIWTEDLVAYEEQCKAELENELTQVGRIAADDVTEAVVARAKKIVKQLADSTWQEPLPAPTVHKAEEIVTRLRGDLARRELEALAGQLTEAHAEGDVDRAESLCDRWEKSEKRARLGADHPLAQQTRACREWVRGVQSERTATAELDAAMDQVSRLCSMPAPWTPRRSRPARDQLHAALHEMEMRQADMPPHDDAAALSFAARERLKALDRVPVRFFATTGGLAALAVGAAILFGGIVWRAGHRSHVATIVRAEIMAFVKAEEFDAAREAWQKAVVMHPWLTDRPLNALAREVEQLFAQWEEEADECLERAVKLVTDCRGVLEKEVPPHVDVLAKAVASDGLIARETYAANTAVAERVATASRTLKKARGELDAAEKRRAAADVADLRLAVETLEKEVEAVEKDARAKVRVIREARVERLQGDLQRLKKLTDTELAASQADIEAARTGVDDVERFAAQRYDALRDDLASLDGRIEDVSGKVKRRNRISAAADRGLEDFMTALDAERAGLPEAFLDDIETVQNSAACVEAAAAWSDVGRAWRDATRGEKRELDELRSALNKARAVELQPAMDGDAEDRLDMLLAVLEESDKDGARALQSLRDYLANSVMNPEVLEAVVEGRKYYTRADEKGQGGYFYGENSINPQSRKLKTLPDAPAKRAAHAIWASTLRDDIEAIRQGRLGCEDGIVQMIDSARSPAVQAGVDPLLVCRIVNELVSAASSKTMLADVESLVAVGDRIGGDVGATPEWIDPAQRRSNLEPEAKKAIDPADLERAVKEARAKIQGVTSRPAFCRIVEFAGWTESAGDKPVVYARRQFAATNAGPVYAIVPEGDDSWKFVEVGRLVNGKVEAIKSAALCFGRPVFVEKAPPSATTRKTGK